MHVELYDADGMSLVPVPADALETLYMLALNWTARNKGDRRLAAAMNAAGKAMDDVKYHGADGGPSCEMEEYHHAP